MPKALQRGLIIAAAAALAMLVGFTGRVLLLGGEGAEQGIPSIGGAFTLVDHQGRTTTERDLAGKLLLVYFGFTFCPDVCPTELQTMSLALDVLGPAAEQVQPVFVSVDPERDTPVQLAEYLKSFHARFLGLTGSPEQVQAAARAYKVYYAKAKAGADDAAYSVDHTGFVYLMDRQNRYLAHFAPGTPPERMAERIRAAL
jgi:protein SCO1/2